MQIIGVQMLTGSAMWCLTVLMISPVTHCHTVCISKTQLLQLGVSR